LLSAVTLANYNGTYTATLGTGSINFTDNDADGNTLRSDNYVTPGAALSTKSVTFTINDGKITLAGGVTGSGTATLSGDSAVISFVALVKVQDVANSPFSSTTFSVPLSCDLTASLVGGNVVFATDTVGQSEWSISGFHQGFQKIPAGGSIMFIASGATVNGELKLGAYPLTVTTNQTQTITVTPSASITFGSPLTITGTTSGYQTGTPIAFTVKDKSGDVVSVATPAVTTRADGTYSATISTRNLNVNASPYELVASVGPGVSAVCTATVTPSSAQVSNVSVATVGRVQPPLAGIQTDFLITFAIAVNGNTTPTALNRPLIEQVNVEQITESGTKVNGHMQNVLFRAGTFTDSVSANILPGDDYRVIVQLFEDDHDGNYLCSGAIISNLSFVGSAHISGIIAPRQITFGTSNYDGSGLLLIGKSPAPQGTIVHEFLENPQFDVLQKTTDTISTAADPGQFFLQFNTASLPAGKYVVEISYLGSSSVLGDNVYIPFTISPVKPLPVLKIISGTPDPVVAGESSVTIKGTFTVPDSGSILANQGVQIVFDNANLSAVIQSNGSFQFTLSTEKLTKGVYVLKLTFYEDKNYLAASWTGALIINSILA